MTRPAAFFIVTLLVSAASAANVDQYVRDLKSKDADVRRTAARELGKLGEDAKDAVPALLLALHDEDVFVRRFAAQSLGEIKLQSKTAISGLVAALKDKDKRVAGAAAGALGKMGADGVKPLTDLLKDKNRPAEARLQALESLGDIGEPAKEAVPAIIDYLKVPDLRLTAANTLGKIGPSAKEAQKALEDILASRGERDRTFRMAVQQAVNKIKAK